VARTIDSSEEKQEHREMNNKATYILLVLGLALTVGCGKAVVDSVDDLTTALKQKGIEYRTRETVNLSRFKYAKIDEAVALKGDELWIEIFHITHEKTYKSFVGSSVLLVAAEAKTQRELPGKPDVYFRKPFIIIVRQEPKKAHVKKALKKIFPEKEK
jgi:hypothetical protein